MEGIVNRSPLPALATFAILALLPLSLQAQPSDEEKMREALGAAPSGVAENAAILDWPAEEGGDFRVLREGSNGWTCLPDQPGDLRDNYEPMCNDAVWMAWYRTVVMEGEPPRVDGLGVSYMLNAEWATSNTDPGARGPSPDNEWVEGGAHIMLVVPDPAMLDHFPDDPSPDHPYVMYKGTPLVHLMIPMEELVSHGRR